jgi:hypothetical protein
MSAYSKRKKDEGSKQNKPRKPIPREGHLRSVCLSLGTIASGLGIKVKVNLESTYVGLSYDQRCI